ncbi:RDD family protein [Akkermansia sp.]|uniref:RDD family protein n=1 Tax=Akkermansia sp. TaxID=1872421 RepID=UPI0025BA5ECF|nr:RDD family protein [Akkermansia sp.]MCC8148079.1 RDD family protein [Akkermansia sp.]
MDIYWIQDHEKKGPLPEVEVISMLEAGLIPENVRAWHAGCAEWVRIHDLPVLKEMFAIRKEKEERRKAEEEAPEDEAAELSVADPVEAGTVPEEAETAEDEGVVLVVPYPYVRFLGRMADVLMHMTLYLAVLRILGVAFTPDFLPGSYEALLYLCLPMVLIEAAFVGTLGTTPGKAMLGVSVRDYQGNRLSFSTAFRRSLFVMVLGLGCFAPSLMALALFFSWWWVRRFGFTPWDRKLGTTDVLNESLTLRKVVMTLVLIILCLQIMYVLLIPWLPEIEASMAASGQM